ncbi:hypothetical protein PQ455_15510 [Sphingomonas naphthae]|uniref:Tetratricopeptide repeat protein n=1 Tax=Sphingomonas naphthae TaxID=1813468 RepID=A0ABY7TIG5_9SPHN|nr:hypothetical protein [Sphingomonas naphthae]WCT73022.1 hypothetical protein PQ455_15510 [Sphingomonas naphthae]
MKPVSTFALGLALALGTAAVVVTPATAAKKEEPAKAKLTPAVQNAAAAAQKAIAAGDFPGAAAQLTTAKAAIVSDDDKNVVGTLMVQNGQKSNDQASVRDGVNLMLESNKASANDQAVLYGLKGQFQSQAKDLAGAEASYLKALEVGSTEPNMVPLIVQTKSQQGKTLDALNFLNAEIAKKLAAGQTVPNDWFARGINDGYAAKSTAPDFAATKDATISLTEKWVGAYPTKSNWRDTLVIYRDMSRLPADAELDGYRLLRTIGGLKGERDYMDYVSSVYLRYPAEAKAVLDEAVAAGQINLASNKGASEINTLVAGKLAADKASLAAGAKGAATAANGKAAMSTADAYLGYGEWQKAIDLYKVAISKGGVDLDIANLHLGMAQARAGQAAEAKTTLASVKGSRAQLAKFWLVYLDHPVTA